MLACRELGYYAHPDVQRELQSRVVGIISTTAVEDINYVQKNARQLTQWGGRYRRPQTGLATAVRRRVLHSGHRWQAPPALQPSAFGPAPLEKEPARDSTSVRARTRFYFSV